jgi:thiol-disulfide isomerase/thioredoxin
MEKNKIIFMVIFIILGLGLAVGLSVFENKGPGKYDELAQCVKNSGAKFFGAFWCPHCADQKRIFGKSAKLLPYTECSNPDRSQNQTCIDAKITGYPTWEFKDGSRLTEVLEPTKLAELTQCTLPQE